MQRDARARHLRPGVGASSRPLHGRERDLTCGRHTRGVTRVRSRVRCRVVALTYRGTYYPGFLHCARGRKRGREPVGDAEAQRWVADQGSCRRLLLGAHVGGRRVWRMLLRREVVGGREYGRHESGAWARRPPSQPKVGRFRAPARDISQKRY